MGNRTSVQLKLSVFLSDSERFLLQESTVAGLLLILIIGILRLVVGVISCTYCCTGSRAALLVLNFFFLLASCCSSWLWNEGPAYGIPTPAQKAPADVLLLVVVVFWNTKDKEIQYSCPSPVVVHGWHGHT